MSEPGTRPGGPGRPPEVDAISVNGLAFARRFPDPLPRIPLLAPASALGLLRRLDDLFAGFGLAGTTDRSAR